MCFIPNGTVISCIDFSENYSLKVQNEIQSMLDGRKLQNASEIVQFLREQTNVQHAGPTQSRKIVNRYVWEIQDGDVDRSVELDYDTVSGSRNMHQARLVSAKDPTLLYYRQLSCFCEACFEGHNESCVQNDHVQPWSLIRLRAQQTHQVRALYDLDGEEVTVGTGGEWIAEEVLVGDHIVVRCEASNDSRFWTMLVDKALHEVRITFGDETGNKFTPGDMVLRRYWYEARNPSRRSYTLRDDRQPSYVFRI
jgi:hypothetical protein